MVREVVVVLDVRTDIDVSTVVVNVVNSVSVEVDTMVDVVVATEVTVGVAT